MGSYPQMKTSLVIGASGFIGNILFHKLESKARYGTCFNYMQDQFSILDITNDRETSLFCEKVAPDIIYNLGALPNVEWAEENIQECRCVNVNAVKNLVQAANLSAAKLVHFSTDYIFDGLAGPYSEDASPNPVNIYGQAKLDAENYIKENCHDWLIIRVTVVYGWESRGKNFISALIDKLSNKQTMKIPIDQIGSPTFADNMLDIVVHLAENDFTGVYNVSGDEVMDRFTFAKIAAEVFELDSSLLLPVLTEELGQRAKRPLNAGFILNKVKRDVPILLMNPAQGLLHMKEHLPNYSRITK